MSSASMTSTKPARREATRWHEAAVRPAQSGTDGGRGSPRPDGHGDGCLLRRQRQGWRLCVRWRCCAKMHRVPAAGAPCHRGRDRRCAGPRLLSGCPVPGRSQVRGAPFRSRFAGGSVRGRRGFRQARRCRAASWADFPVPTGCEEERRFTPLRRLQGLHTDSPSAGGKVSVEADAASGLRAQEG